MRQRKLPLSIVLLAGLLFHLWFLGLAGAGTTYDSREYIEPAKNLLAGRGFVNGAGVPETIRTPGYPAFLAIFYALGLGNTVAVIVQHLLCVATAAMVGLSLRGREGLIAAALIAFDAAMVANANVIMTEALFAFVVTAALLAARHPRGAVAAGILLGVAPLIRPIAIFLAIPIVIAVFLHNRRAAIVIAIFALLIPGAWVVRNARAAGVPTLTSIAGENMLFWRAAGALAMRELPGFWYSPTEAGEAEYQRLLFRVYQKNLRAPADAQADAAGAKTHAERAAVYNRMGREIVLRHFGAFFRSAVNGTIHLITDPARDFLGRLGSITRDVAMLWLVLLRIAIVIAAIAGIAPLWRADRPLALIALLTITYFLIMSAGSEANFHSARFRVPIAPFEAMLAAFGATRFAWRR